MLHIESLKDREDGGDYWVDDSDEGPACGAACVVASAAYLACYPSWFLLQLLRMLGSLVLHYLI